MVAALAIVSSSPAGARRAAQRGCPHASSLAPPPGSSSPLASNVRGSRSHLTAGRWPLSPSTTASADMGAAARFARGASPSMEPKARCRRSGRQTASPRVFHAGARRAQERSTSRAAPRTICAAAAEGLAEWGEDNTILFTIFRSGISCLVRRRHAHACDGARRVATRDQSLLANLPARRHAFLYLATANATDTSKAPPSVYVRPLDGSDRQLLERIHSRAVYIAPGICCSKTKEACSRSHSISRVVGSLARLCRLLT